MDVDQQRKLLTRLNLALQTITEINNEKKKDENFSFHLKRALNVGSSQVNLLKSWTTDKVDKNPLIRTQQAATGYYPLIAKNNKQLTLFPNDYIAKELKNGIEIPLEDSRSKDYIRVKREALTWWLENGEEASDSIIDILNFIEKANIRKIDEYERVTFTNICGGGAPIKRQKVQTTIPVLDTFLKKHEIINAIFEGHDIIGHVEEKDLEYIKKIQDVLMPKLIDPNDIIRITQGLMDKKRRAIPLRPYGGISSREMRHALDGNHWTIEATGLQVTETRKNIIIRDTCGVLISLAVTSVKAGAKKVLERLLDSTYINNQRLSSILVEMEPSGDYEIIVCQSVLGMTVNNSSKFLGSQFYIKERIPIIIDEGDKFKKLDETKTKIFVWKRKDLNEGKTSFTIKTVNTIYKINSEIRMVHLESGGASGEAIINTDKLLSATIYTKDSRAYVDLISSLIVWAKLWKSSDLPFITAEHDHKATIELKKHFMDPTNWPFEKIEGLIDKSFKAEIEGVEIPLFKELNIIPASETNFRAEQIAVKVDLNTLVVKKDRGSESYMDVVSVEMINLLVEKYSNERHILPPEVISVDPIVLNRIVDKNKIRSMLLETFFIFVSILDLGFTGEYSINKELKKEMTTLFRFTNQDRMIMESLMNELLNDNNWRNNIFTIYSISLLYVLCECCDLGFYRKVIYKSKVTMISDKPPKIKISVTDILVCEIPLFQVGSLTIDKLGNVVYMNMPLFNLPKITIVSDQKQYDYPILKACPLKDGVPHEQIIDPLFKDLYKYSSKHVLMRNKCYIVEKPTGKTINGLMSEIENNQNILRIKTSIGMNEEEAVEEGELDEETINFESLFDIFD